MSDTGMQRVDSDVEDEPDEDPKLMLLVEAGLVPGLDDNLRHLRHRQRKKKKKKTKRGKQSEGESRKTKKAKLEDPGEERNVLSGIISNLNKPTKYKVFQNCLMLSEWLVKVPDNFEDNWIMIPCPPGKRVLVIASWGSTRCFAKSGDFMFYFQSALPGGHAVEKDESSKSLTILDCIWHHGNKTYYVLDALSWNNTHLLHCEAKFRFFWLKQKMSEINSKLEESEKNHYRFSLLPTSQCRRDELVSDMTSFCLDNEFKGNIDGFLFYDMSAAYFSGTSSVVGWLKPFMVPEVFDIPASPELLVDIPNDYAGLQQYISEFEENRKKVIRKERKIRGKRLGLGSTALKEEKCVEDENRKGIGENGNRIDENGKVIDENRIKIEDENRKDREDVNGKEVESEMEIEAESIIVEEEVEEQKVIKDQEIKCKEMAV